MGEGSGKEWLFARIFSVSVLASFRGPSAVRRPGSALWVFFPAIIFIFYLKGSQSWLPLKQHLEKTECPRVEV